VNLFHDNRLACGKEVHHGGKEVWLQGTPLVILACSTTTSVSQSVSWEECQKKVFPLVTVTKSGPKNTPFTPDTSKSFLASGDTFALVLSGKSFVLHPHKGKERKGKKRKGKGKKEIKRKRKKKKDSRPISLASPPVPSFFPVTHLGVL